MPSFKKSYDNHQHNKNLGGRFINDLKERRSIRVFFALNAEVQALWEIAFPCHVYGNKEDGTPYDFVINKTFTHPGINLENTSDIPNDKRCSYALLYKYLKEHDEINNDEVILTVNGKPFRKAQILGKWENPEDTRMNDFKYNIPKPGGKAYRCHDWLFPVVDKSDISTLKVMRIKFALGQAIFDRVQEGINEDGEEADPMLYPHAYQLEYCPTEKNPQKKYKVSRFKNDKPEDQVMKLLTEELDTKHWVRPVEPSLLNRLLYDALCDKNYWELIKAELEEDAREIFNGSEQELKEKLGIIRKPKKDKEETEVQTGRKVQDAPHTTPVTQVTSNRDFWAFVNGQTVQKKEVELQQLVNSGQDFPVMLVGESEWKTLADYGIKKAVTPPPPPSKPAAPPAPPAPPAPTAQKKTGFKRPEQNGSPKQDIPQPPAGQQPASDKVQCDCGAMNSILADACSECGAPIDAIPF